MTSPRTATALIERFENQMGWDPNEVASEKGMEVWKVKAIEAGKINRWLAKHPRVTLALLGECLDWCVKTGVVLTVPYGLTYQVDKFLKAREQPEVVTNLEEEIARAISTEEGRDDPDAVVWLGRFMRAAGPARQALLQEWRTERG